MVATANTGPSAAQQAASNNMNARNIVLGTSLPMLQQIASGTVLPDAAPIVNIPPQNVGLIKGFLVEINANVTGGSGTSTLTPQGPANMLQNVLFTDLQNYQRINTTGWHLSAVNSAKSKRPFFSSTASDSPIGFGSNAVVVKAPATIATTVVTTARMFYWVPLAYGAQDLTGAIYAGVVNATMNLQLTFSNSAQFFKASGDAVGAVYSGSNGTVTSYTYTVYQSYLDQLPATKDGIILPQIDINTIYELKQSNFAGIPVNQDFNIGYSNFRHFLSTILIYDNGGTFNAGTDINYFSFRTANYTDTRKADPFVWKGHERQVVMTDFPLGMYYFDTRDRPIFTTQQGNTNLVVNASTVNANANILVGWEMLANVQNLQGAGSLSSGT
jgi:hypothetical protein